MERKIGLIIIIGTLAAVLMVKSLTTDKIDFLVISDKQSEVKSYNDIFYENFKVKIENYDKSYEINNLSARDLYDLIIFNEKKDNSKLTIKQIINKSEIISIEIGQSEILNHENINVYLYYMDLVLNEIRKINSNDIFLLSLYSDDKNISNVNYELKNIAKKYDVNFLNINEKIQNNCINENTKKLNLNGENIIAKEFINTYKNLKK